MADIINPHPREFLHMAEYMVSYRFNQSDTERAGSVMNRTKSKERTLLKDDVYEALVFLATNLLNPHEINLEKLARTWIQQEGRRVVNENQAESRVVSRLRAERSSRVVLHKDWWPS